MYSTPPPQSVYFTVTPNWTTRWWGVLPLCRDAVGVFYSLTQLGHSLEGVLPLCRDAVCLFYGSPNWLSQLNSWFPFSKTSWHPTVKNSSLQSWREKNSNPPFNLCRAEERKIAEWKVHRLKSFYDDVISSVDKFFFDKQDPNKKCVDRKGTILKTKPHVVTFHIYLGQPVNFSRILQSDVKKIKILLFLYASWGAGFRIF